MNNQVKNCELCGRELSFGYSGNVCPMCKQEFDVLKKANELANKEAQIKKIDSTAYPSPSSPYVTENKLQVESNNITHTVSPIQTTNDLPSDIVQRIQQIENIQRISAYAWLVIGIIQIIAALSANVPLWIFVIGLWNVCMAFIRSKRANEIHGLDTRIPGIVEREKWDIYIFLFINFFLGAILGIAGAVLDLAVRDQLIKNRLYFERDYATKRMKSHTLGMSPGLIAIIIVSVALTIWITLGYQYGLPLSTGDHIVWDSTSISMADAHGKLSEIITISDFEMVRVGKDSGGYNYTYQFTISCDSDTRSIEYTLSFYDNQHNLLGSCSGQSSVLSGEVTVGGNVILAKKPTTFDFTNFFTSG